MTEAQILKIKPKVSLKILPLQSDPAMTGPSTMFNTKTDLNATRNKLSISKFNTVNTSSSPLNSSQKLPSTGKSPKNTLAILHRRMTIVGQTKNISLY